MRKTVSDYFYHKGMIERKSLNYPVQGSSGEITKISCIYIFDRIITDNLFGIVKFVNTIHDENVLEVPLNIHKRWELIIKEYMEKAGSIYCKRVPLKCDPESSIFWKK